MNQSVKYLNCTIISVQTIGIFVISPNGALRPINRANFKTAVIGTRSYAR